MAKTHYDILNVPKNASQDEIKKSFKKLAATHHPDKGGDEQRFKEINEAHSVLGDPHKRRVYDAQGSGTGMGFSSGGRSGRMPNAFRTPFEDVNFMNVFFNGNRTGNRNVTGNRTGGGNPPHRRPTHHKVYNATIFVTLEEAFKGCKKAVPLECRGVMCPDCMGVCDACGGQGVIEEVVHRSLGGATLIQTVRRACDVCGGQGKKKKMDKADKTDKADADANSPCGTCGDTGEYTKTASVTIEVPAGLPEDFSTQVPHPIDKDGLLVINVELRNTTLPGYERRGDDLVYTLKVGLLDAMVGARFEVPHPSGKGIVLDYTCTNDTILPHSSKTIPGKGMRNNTNLIVEFAVDFPRTRRALGSLGRETTFKKMREIYGELFDG